MTEAAFAKTFLSSLDSRPVKLSGDHVEDAKSFPARPPYILPRPPRPMRKPSTKTGAAPPGHERGVTVLVRSLRNPPLEMRLGSQPRGTSLLEIKTRVADKVGCAVGKIKVLHNKRPVVDSKILGEIAGDEDDGVELSVMVMGQSAAAGDGPVVVASGRDALTTEVFWEDLRGFLAQRLRDEEVAGGLVKLFRGSVDGGSGEKRW